MLHVQQGMNLSNSPAHEDSKAMQSIHRAFMQEVSYDMLLGMPVAKASPSAFPLAKLKSVKSSFISGKVLSWPSLMLRCSKPPRGPKISATTAAAAIHAGDA